MGSAGNSEREDASDDVQNPQMCAALRPDGMATSRGQPFAADIIGRRSTVRCKAVQALGVPIADAQHSASNEAGAGPWCARLVAQSGHGGGRGLQCPNPARGLDGRRIGPEREDCEVVQLLHRIVRWRSLAGSGPAAKPPHPGGSEDTSGIEEMELEPDPRRLGSKTGWPRPPT